MAKLILITGGARSGKSRYAEQLLADKTAVTYIATAEILDHEMEARVARHRARRPQHWQTLVSPLQLAATVQQAEHPWVLIDCLAVWVANLLQVGWDEARDCWADAAGAEATLLPQVQELLAAIAARPGTVVAVTNEVGSGLVPVYPLGRSYRDVLGLTNQAVAAAAQQVFCCISGIPLCLKGGA